MKKIVILLIIVGICVFLTACFDSKTANNNYQIPENYLFTEEEKTNIEMLKENGLNEKGAQFVAWKLSEASCGKIVEFERLNEVDKVVPTVDYGVKDINGNKFRLEVLNNEPYAIYDIQVLKYIYKNK